MCRHWAPPNLPRECLASRRLSWTFIALTTGPRLKPMFTLHGAGGHMHISAPCIQIDLWQQPWPCLPIPSLVSFPIISVFCAISSYSVFRTAISKTRHNYRRLRPGRHRLCLMMSRMYTKTSSSVALTNGHSLEVRRGCCLGEP
jgi:hypothetical protein